MSTSMEAVSKFVSPSRSSLDGIDSLVKAVVRETPIGAHAEILRQGDIPHAGNLLLEGLAFRYRLLRDGRRQITAILVPGDICDLEAVMRGHADHAVATFTPCMLGEIPAAQISDPDGSDSGLHGLVSSLLLRDEAIAREWMVGLGRRSAKERVAHLFCELRERLRAVDLCGADGYELNLTQSELADALGLSAVHINRVLRDLCKDGLAEVRSRAVHILDYPALVHLADFDPAYLELR